MGVLHGIFSDLGTHSLAPFKATIRKFFIFRLNLTDEWC